jgi:hypothetical protein
MGEYAFRLVALAMAALGHFAVAFDLLLPAHVACSCDSPALSIAATLAVVSIAVVVAIASVVVLTIVVV